MNPGALADQVPEGQMERSRESRNAKRQPPPRTAADQPLDTGLIAATVVHEQIPCATVAQLIRETGRLLAAENARIPSHEVMSMRRAAMFAERYGVPGKHSSTVRGIAERANVSRERVRQILQKMITRRSNIRIPTTIVETLHQQARRHMPSAVKELDNQLRGILGESLSIVDADRFARDFLNRELIAIEQSIERPGVAQIGPVAIGAAGNDRAFVAHVRRVSLEMIASCGAANVYTVAGIVSEKRGVAIRVDAVRRVTSQLGHFCSLDETGSWFWFGAGARNRILNVTIKVLSVATQRIDIEDIHAAAARGRSGKSGDAVDLPLYVLREILRKTPACRAMKSGGFGLQTPLAPEQALGPIELQLYGLFSKAGGVLDWGGIVAGLRRARMAPATACLLIRTSPILVRLNPGLYALRGRPLDPMALLDWPSRAPATPREVSR